MNTLLQRVSERLPDSGLGEGFKRQTGVDSCRLFHGRGGCYPGFEQVTVDMYYPLLLVTFFKPPASADFEIAILDDLQALACERGFAALAVQRRYLAAAPLQCYRGCLPQQVFARRRGLAGLSELQTDQRTG